MLENAPSEPKTKAKSWQKSTTIDSLSFLYALEGLSKNWGTHSHSGGEFHILFSLHKFEMHELTIPFSISNDGEGTLGNVHQCLLGLA